MNADREDKIHTLVSVVEKLFEQFVDVEAKLQDLSTVRQLDTQIKCLEENFHRHETDLEKRLAMIDGGVAKHVQDKLHEFEEHTMA